MYTEIEIDTWSSVTIDGDIHVKLSRIDAVRGAMLGIEAPPEVRADRAEYRAYLDRKRQRGGTP